jgi:hypothetical protein
MKSHCKCSGFFHVTVFLIGNYQFYSHSKTKLKNKVMKQEVIEFFQNLPDEKHEQFNKAYELYRQSPTKNVGTERSLNVQGFSERGLENLLYDLQKMHGITDVEKIAIVKSEKLKVRSPRLLADYILAFTEEELRNWAQTECVEKEIGLAEVIELALANEENNIAAILTEELDKINVEKQSIINNQEVKGVEGIRPEDSHPGTLINGADVHDMNVVDINKKEVTDVNALVEENETLKLEKEDLQYEKEDLEEENEDLKEEIENLKTLPKIDAQSIRVEFPFLNSTDCPDELKILVADKITAWNEYLALQIDIAKAESGENNLDKEQLASIAKRAVECFDENQKIYDELNAYQTTGKILGLHPIFKRLQLTREVETMTSEELYKYKGSSAKYFTDNKQSLAKAEKAKDQERITEIKTRVVEREQKLAFVNKRLGINPK